MDVDPRLLEGIAGDTLRKLRARIADLEQQLDHDVDLIMQAQNIIEQLEQQLAALSREHEAWEAMRSGKVDGVDHANGSGWVSRVCVRYWMAADPVDAVMAVLAAKGETT